MMSERNDFQQALHDELATDVTNFGRQLLETGSGHVESSSKGPGRQIIDADLVSGGRFATERRSYGVAFLGERTHP